MMGSPQFSTPPTPFNVAGPNKQGGGSGNANIVANGVTLALPAVLPGAVGRNVPAAAEFTLVNALSATIVDNTNGPLVWQCNHAAVGSNDLSSAQTPVPVGSWTYTMHAAFYGTNLALPFFGVSDGTKYALCFFVGAFPGSGGNNPEIQISNWTNTTTSSGSATTFSLGLCPNPLWFRVSWAASTTTLTFSMSIDGFTWFVMSAQAGFAFLVPSQFCIGGNISINNSTTPLTISADFLAQT